MGQKEHAQITPQPGWVEHDAAEIWRNTEEVIAAGLADAERMATAAIWVDDQTVSMVVTDQGKGFDPFGKIPERFDDKVLSKESGRGLMMMITMMDQIIYADEGRRVLMVKTLETMGSLTE